jgi:hypothetical protein
LSFSLLSNLPDPNRASKGILKFAVYTQNMGAKIIGFTLEGFLPTFELFRISGS